MINSEKKNKHMCLDERIEIQECLCKGMTFKAIAQIDLPRAVKFKSRKSKKEDYVPKGVKIGRTYEDFLNFIETIPNIV